MDDGGLLCLSFLSYLDAAQPHKLSSPNAVDVGAAQDPTRWHSVKRMPLEANGGSAPGFHCFGKALTHVAPSESYFCHHDKEPGMIVLITLRAKFSIPFPNSRATFSGVLANSCRGFFRRFSNERPMPSTVFFPPFESSLRA